MNSSEVLSNLALPVLIALVVAGRGFGVDEDYVARWSDSAGLELTTRTRPVVRRNLTWSRRCRTAGGLLGFLAPEIYEQVISQAVDLDVTSEPDPGWSLLLMFVGYLLGATFAELLMNRPGRHPGTAVPGPRQLRDYLSRHLLIMQRGLAILAAVLVMAYALLVPHARLPLPDPIYVAAFGFTGVVLAVVIEALQRTIIGRRQTAAGADDLALDDAMRSSSVHLVAGAGIALLIFFTAGLVSALLIIVDTPGGLIHVVVFPFLVLSAIFFWLDGGKPHGFRVRDGEREGIPT